MRTTSPPPSAANDARCGSGPAWNVSISANGGLVQLRGEPDDTGGAPVARVRDEADEEGLAALVHVLEVAALLELARVVPGPDRAADGADPDVAAADVVAVLGVVDHGQPAAAAGDVDPRLPRLLVAARRPLEVAVGRLERRASGLDRGRVAQLQQLQLLVPVERDAHVDVRPRPRRARSPRAASSCRSGSRRGGSRAPGRSRAAARPIALELAELPVVGLDAVAPGVARVVDDDRVRRRRARRGRRRSP